MNKRRRKKRAKRFLPHPLVAAFMGTGHWVIANGARLDAMRKTR